MRYKKIDVGGILHIQRIEVFNRTELGRALKNIIELSTNLFFSEASQRQDEGLDDFHPLEYTLVEVPFKCYKDQEVRSRLPKGPDQIERVKKLINLCEATMQLIDRTKHDLNYELDSMKGSENDKKMRGEK